MAIFPFYLELILDNAGMAGLRVVRIVRLTRVFRIFKLSRYSKGFKVMLVTFKLSSSALSLLGILLGLGSLMISSFIYYAENGELDNETNIYCRFNPVINITEESPF